MTVRVDPRASDFLARTGGLPWVWGERDCATWAASLWAEVTGRDPAASLRGRYCTAFGCRAVLARGGGLLAVARALMAAEDTGPGDGIGVVRFDDAGRLVDVAGLLVGGRAVLKRGAGVIFLPDGQAQVLARWPLPGGGR